jgi:hypothetical protein
MERILQSRAALATAAVLWFFAIVVPSQSAFLSPKFAFILAAGVISALWVVGRERARRELPTSLYFVMPLLILAIGSFAKWVIS